MDSSVRTIRSGIVAFALGGLIAGCSGDGGVLRIFLGVNGKGTCSDVTVDVDLTAASAVLARLPDGAVDCVLSEVLAADGCSLQLLEWDNGGMLRIVVSGCVIDAVENLVRCGFSTADTAALSNASEGFCDCHSAVCDPGLPVCASQVSDPSSCEDCENGKDDDGNHLTDCEDSNCRYAEPCAETTTTSTTSTTTTSSTMSPVENCTVVFRMTEDLTLGSLQWTTDYSSSGGEFPGLGSDVECASLVASAVPAFNDDDPAESLDAGLISLAGIDGPTNLAECSFHSPGLTAPADFQIEVTEASDLDLNELWPRPLVIVSSVTCNPVELAASTVPVVVSTVP